MKIQLDTTAKTIKIEESVNLNELVETLERLLPNGLWKEFSLETNTVINNWNTYPVIQPYITPYRPYEYPWITYGSGTNLVVESDKVKVSYKSDPVFEPEKHIMSLNTGVFNVEA